MTSFLPRLFLLFCKFLFRPPGLWKPILLFCVLSMWIKCYITSPFFWLFFCLTCLYLFCYNKLNVKPPACRICSPFGSSEAALSFALFPLLNNVCSLILLFWPEFFSCLVFILCPVLHTKTSACRTPENSDMENITNDWALHFSKKYLNFTLNGTHFLLME